MKNSMMVNCKLDIKVNCFEWDLGAAKGNAITYFYSWAFVVEKRFFSLLCVLYNENENKIHFEFFIIRLNKFADRDNAKISHFKMYEVWCILKVI